MKQPKPQTVRFAWALYDLANTIFSMNIVSLYFVLWLTVDRGCPEFYYSLTLGSSIFLAAFFMPFLGELSDSLKRKQPFLISFTLGCCIFTALLGLVKTAFPALLLDDVKGRQVRVEGRFGFLQINKKIVETPESFATGEFQLV